MTMLSTHFALSEFTVSETAARRGMDNNPGKRERENLERLAGVLERIRLVLDEKPILITSGYRSPPVNAAVGGSRNSAHLFGLAADFTCPGFGTPLQVCRKLEPHLADLLIDQLIYEFGTWVHLGLRETDVRPRHQVLTIDSKGTRPGFG